MATVIMPLRQTTGYETTIEIPYTDLIAAAATQSVTLFTAPSSTANSTFVLQSCMIELVTAFTSGTITGLTAQIGQTADTDAYHTALEVLSGSPTLAVYENRGVWRGLAGNVVRALFTASGANLGNATVTALTAGKIRVKLVFQKYKNV